MGEFQKIETQEQFDAAIGERLKRERESVLKQYSGYLSPDEVTKKYEGYISPDDFKKKSEESSSKIEELTKGLNEANTKLAGNIKEIADKEAKIKEYETHSVKMRIAHESGLSYEAVDFLKGEDEESIKKSAAILSGLVKQSRVAPLASSEHFGDGSNNGSNKEALKSTLKQLKGE